MSGAPLLPPEIVHHLIKDVGRDDVYALAMTCRHLHVICIPIYFEQCGLDISQDSLSFSESSHFSAPLDAMIASTFMNAMAFEEINFIMPWCAPITTISITHATRIEKLLQKLSSVKSLTIHLRLGRHSIFSFFTAAKWMSAFCNMLAVASSKSLHLTLRSTGNFEQELVQSGLSSDTGTDQDLSELPSYVNLALPASPIQVDTLAFSAPALLARFLAKSTLSANSITRLIICPDGNRSLSMNARFLESFHLPNLRHCQMDHVRIVPTASFHKFLSRHTKLQSLLLERMYLPVLEQDWPTKEPKISAAILPALTTLAADTATALWFLHDRQALPHLQRLEITAGSMQSRSVGTQDPLKPLWNCIAFRNPTDLSSLALRDAFIVSRFVGVRGLSGLPEHPLRTITALILDSGGVEWMRNAQDADAHGLQAQTLGALPAWVSRLFPALESLDLSKLDLTVSAPVEGEFLAEMGSLRPNVTIRHSIQRTG